MMRTVSSWIDFINTGPGASRLAEIYGPDFVEERRRVIMNVLKIFGETYGFERKVIVVRVPGRVNLMGRHVDHRGGFVNPMVIPREVIMVAERREDSYVEVHNAEERFESGKFEIGEELPTRKISTVDEWRRWTQENIERKPEKERKSWINYVKSVCYLQNVYMDNGSYRRRLLGANIVCYGDIPRSAGLSSSSALVVATYLTVSNLNGLEIPREKMVEYTGIGEWYVGTRGGWGDQAAMLFSRKGFISHIGFFPFKISYIPFPAGVSILLCNSFVAASKMTGARSIFNEKVSTYEFGFELMKKFNPDLKRFEYLRDVNSENFETVEIYRMIKSLPEKISRSELRSLLPEKEEWLNKLFKEHEEPKEGYDLRGVCLFGISECERSRKTEWILPGDVELFGRLMNVSHDADRVVKSGLKWQVRVTDEYLERLTRSEGEARLEFQSGYYGCGTVETDFLVDTALKVPGVLGASIVGAGLGGCVEILVDKKSVGKVADILVKEYYCDETRPKNGIMLVNPVEGACLI
ncbi:MAG: galactokinase family protein [Thermoproteota archaeon]